MSEPETKPADWTGITDSGSPGTSADPPPAEGRRYRATLGLLCVLGGMLGLAGLYFVPIPAGNRDALMLALGIVLGWGGAVVTFEFGASATGRKAAEAAINKVTQS